MDNIGEKDSNLDDPQQQKNQEDRLSPKIKEQDRLPYSADTDSGSVAPPNRPKRPQIPMVPQEHIEEFDYISYQDKQGKGYGKWFLLVVLIGVLVWMIPGSFQSADAPSIKHKRAQVKIPGVSSDIDLYLTDNQRLGLKQFEINIDLGGTTEDKINLVLEALFAQNQKVSGPLPREIIVRDVFINGNEAVISLDGAFRKKFLGGAWSELLAVYSLVNTVADNFDQIHAVRILIDDREAHFFVSHVNLVGPIAPSASLLVLEEIPDI